MGALHIRRTVAACNPSRGIILGVPCVVKSQIATPKNGTLLGSLKLCGSHFAVWIFLGIQRLVYQGVSTECAAKPTCAEFKPESSNYADLHALQSPYEC